MKEEYSSYVELPDMNNYQINQKLIFENQLKTKLKFKAESKVKGLDHIPPNHTAEFTRVEEGWIGIIKKNS